MILAIPCEDGKHIAAVVHRTGGLPASEKNTCGICGRMIHRPTGVWIVDYDREAEYIAMEGLDIRGYSGKWKQAQRLVSMEQVSTYAPLPYWERVRLVFLELGGEFVDGRRA